MKKTVLEKYGEYPRRWVLYLVITLILVLILGWSAAGLSFKGIAAKGAEVASGIFHGILSPDTKLLFSTATDGVP